MSKGKGKGKGMRGRGEQKEQGEVVAAERGKGCERGKQSNKRKGEKGNERRESEVAVPSLHAFSRSDLVGELPRVGRENMRWDTK